MRSALAATSRKPRLGKSAAVSTAGFYRVPEPRAGETKHAIYGQRRGTGFERGVRGLLDLAWAVHRARRSSGDPAAASAGAKPSGSEVRSNDRDSREFRFDGGVGGRATRRAVGRWARDAAGRTGHETLWNPHSCGRWHGTSTVYGLPNNAIER
jgi:hypothetical protein